MHGRTLKWYTNAKSDVQQFWQHQSGISIASSSVRCTQVQWNHCSHLEHCTHITTTSFFFNRQVSLGHCSFLFGRLAAGFTGASHRDIRGSATNKPEEPPLIRQPKALTCLHLLALRLLWGIWWHHRMPAMLTSQVRSPTANNFICLHLLALRLLWGIWWHHRTLASPLCLQH